MDKYEFNIKLEQIKKLAARKDYKAAAAIANSMDWRKMKDWATLATIINVQEEILPYSHITGTRAEEGLYISLQSFLSDLDSSRMRKICMRNMFIWHHMM